MRLLGLAALVGCCLWGLSACGGDDEGGGETEGAGGGGNAGGAGQEQMSMGTSPSFAADIHPIFRAKCAGTGCHSSAPYGGVSMLACAETDVAAAKTSSQQNIALIVTRIQQGTMPPAGDPVSADELALIEEWQMGGFAD